MNVLDIPQRLKDKLEAHRARAIAEAQAREQRTRILQVLQLHIPRTKDMKQRQLAIDTCTDRIMEILATDYDPSKQLKTED